MFRKNTHVSDKQQPNTPEDEVKAPYKKRPRASRKFLVVYIFTLLLISLALVVLSYFGHVRAADGQVQPATISQNTLERNDLHD